MRSLRVTPHTTTGETANFLMMGRELRLPEQLLHGRTEEAEVSRETYAAALQDRMGKAHDLLRQRHMYVIDIVRVVTKLPS